MICLYDVEIKKVNWFYVLGKNLKYDMEFIDM